MTLKERLNQAHILWAEYKYSILDVYTKHRLYTKEEWEEIMKEMNCFLEGKN